MAKPVLLDLYCGAGGAAMGYALAGFEVIGVDIEPQPRYPFEFHQVDALIMLGWLLDGGYVPRSGLFLEDFAAIHASPPCQLWAQATLSWRRRGRQYPDLIMPTRPLLAATGLPWVIENVPGAPLRPDVRLCGCMFGLEILGVGQLLRERWFELSWLWPDPPLLHDHHAPSISIAGHGTPSWQRARTGHIGVAEWRNVMGIDWMNRDELTEAIPPAYTGHVGTRLMAHLEAVHAA